MCSVILVGVKSLKRSRQPVERRNHKKLPQLVHTDGLDHNNRPDMLSFELMLSSNLSRLTRASLRERAEALQQRMSPCNLCPHRCGARRLEGESGNCRLTSMVIVASAHAHFGEEPPLVGHRGSGTIFFGSCNLRCVFCQNAHISHSTAGERVSPARLARLMIALQDAGCHNINLVTPTHLVAGIVQALIEAHRLFGD